MHDHRHRNVAENDRHHHLIIKRAESLVSRIAVLLLRDDIRGFAQILRVGIVHAGELLALLKHDLRLCRKSRDDLPAHRGILHGLAIVQDIIMPLKKEPLTPKQHLWYLRFLSLGVAVFFLCGSIFLAQMDYINMFLTIMTSIWCGGAGPVMIGGLYSRFGTTAGAFASLIGGAVVSVGGIAMQQNWAERIYPWLARLGYCDSIDYMLQTISAPFSPYIVWKMDALKFPINSMEIFFIAMITGILCYVVVSLITFKKPYNLDQMLHRGIYSIDGEKRIKSPWTWRNVFSKLINITPEYTRGDKIIAWSVFFYSFVYQLLFMFVIVVVWNAISPWPKEWWSTYFYFGSIIVACVIGIISTVWMVIGGCIDLRRLFLDLAARVDNPLDDGRVEGNISLMDRQKIEEIKEKGEH